MSARFTLLGFPVEVRTSFLLVFLLAYPQRLDAEELIRVGLWVFVVFVSILWHELGHALVMRAFGRRARIELWALGGLTYWGVGPTPTTWRRIAVSLAGPVAGFVLGFGALTLSHVVAPTTGTAWAMLASYLIWVNLIWGALNLIPMLPLDGGKVMQALLDAIWKGRGEVIAQVVSVVVAAVVCILAIWVNWAWVAFLAVFAGVRMLTRLAQVRAEARDTPLWNRLEEGWEHLASGDKEPGMKITEEVLLSAKSDRLRAVAAEQLAWQWLLDGDVDRTKAQLKIMPASYRPSTILRGALELRAGNGEASIPLLEEVVEKEPEALSVRLLVEAYLFTDRSDAAEKLLQDPSLRELISSSQEDENTEEALSMNSSDPEPG